ncbi:BnaCnng76500D, partial [Brassica napus]
MNSSSNCTAGARPRSSSGRAPDDPPSSGFPTPT